MSLRNGIGVNGTQPSDLLRDMNLYNDPDIIEVGMPLPGNCNLDLGGKKNETSRPFIHRDCIPVHLGLLSAKPATSCHGYYDGN